MAHSGSTSGAPSISVSKTSDSVRSGAPSPCSGGEQGGVVRVRALDHAELEQGGRVQVPDGHRIGVAVSGRRQRMVGQGGGQPGEEGLRIAPERARGLLQAGGEQMEEGLLFRRRRLLGLPGERGVHVHRPVEDHGGHPVGEEVGVDRSEDRPVGEAVVADLRHAQGLADPVDVPRRVDRVDERLGGGRPGLAGPGHGGEERCSGQRLTGRRRDDAHTDGARG